MLFDTGQPETIDISPADWWEVIGVSIAVLAFLAGIVAWIIHQWIKGSLIPKVINEGVKPTLDEHMEAIHEVQHQVSDNGGRNNPPTMRDEISRVQSQLNWQGQRLDTQGVLLSRQASQLEQQSSFLHSIRQELNHHEEVSAKVVDKIVEQTADQGITLHLGPLGNDSEGV